MTRRVYLWRGYKSQAKPTDRYAIVDDDDFNRVMAVHQQWRLHSSGYAVCGKNSTTLLMHRLILEVTDSSIHIDHQDHDTLNNVRSNLIAGTQTDNNRNAKFVGVGFHKAAGRWRAWSRYECKHLGLFDTKEEALAAVAVSEAERLMI